MKNLSEKFDSLPQDFDREAIWKGIAKPKRPLFYRPYFWVAFLEMASAVFVLYVFSNTHSFLAEPESVASKNEASTAEKSRTPFREIPKELLLTKKENQEIGSYPKYPQKAQATSHASLSVRLEESQYGAVTEAQAQEVADQTKTTDNQPPSIVHCQMESRIEAFSYSPPHLKINLQKENSFDPAEPVASEKIRRSALAIRGSLGAHRPEFSSTNQEWSDWRSGLEKPQLDFGLGLRYEHLLKRNFFFQLSVNYDLYKNKIDTSNVLPSNDPEVAIDYKLYNHYHVLSGHLEVGKRFYQEEFFWDISGGLGLKFGQISEVDFFVSGNKLASEEEIQRLYRSSTDVFFTSQAALGRHLSPRLFARLGVQISSRIDLTAPQVESRHRVSPFNAFIEVGMRL